MNKGDLRSDEQKRYLISKNEKSYLTNKGDLISDGQKEISDFQKKNHI